MYTEFTASYRSSCVFSSGCISVSVSPFPHAPHFSVHGKRSERDSRRNYTFLIFSYQLLSANSVERFLTSPDRILYPTEPPEAVGARTSHPMTCAGCYHAQVMAVGSLSFPLSSPIRDYLTFPKMVWIAVLSQNIFAAESRRTLRSGYRRILTESAGKFVVLQWLFGFQGACTASGFKLLSGTAEKEYILSHTMTFSAHLYSAFTET